MTELIYLINQGQNRQYRKPQFQLTQKLLSSLQTETAFFSHKDKAIIFIPLFDTELKQIIFGPDFENFQNFGKIFLNSQRLAITFQIRNQLGQRIKANSQYQKTSLINLVMTLNQRLNSYSFKVHPLSGQIFMQNSYILEQKTSHSIFDIQKSLHQFLKSYQKQRIFWRYIIEHLELIQFKYGKGSQDIEHEFKKYNNNLILYYNRKSESFLEYFKQKKGQQAIQHHKDKNEYENSLHKKYFVDTNITVPTKKKNSDMVNIDSQKRSLIKQQVSFLKLDSNRIKCSNYSYIHLDKTDLTYSKFEKILSKTSENPLKKFQHLFKTKDKTFKLAFRHKISDDIQKQYMIAQKLSRKKIFYTFIHQYTVIANQNKIGKYYVASRIQNKANSMPLENYLIKNHNTLGFITKLRLLLQYLCISYVCASDFKNLCPSLKIQNIQLTHKNMIRLVNLDIKSSNIIEEVKSMITMLIFNEAFKFFRTKRSFTVQKYSKYGPSIIIMYFCKMILENNSRNKISIEQNSQQIEEYLSNLIIFIARVIDMIENAQKFETKMWVGTLK